MISVGEMPRSERKAEKPGRQIFDNVDMYEVEL
jgi:hypothetical protein